MTDERRAELKKLVETTSLRNLAGRAAALLQGLKEAMEELEER